jgi:hypothetical protein
LQVSTWNGGVGGAIAFTAASTLQSSEAHALLPLAVHQAQASCQVQQTAAGFPLSSFSWMHCVS